MHVRKIAMLRYKSTGAGRCSAMADRAMRARAPVASTRPATEQKIHTGKKEPKMLYSGAWEQPSNTSGAARDTPARTPTEGVRCRSRSVDSIFMPGISRMCPILVPVEFTTSSTRPQRTTLWTVYPNPHDRFALDKARHRTGRGRTYRSHVSINLRSQSCHSIEP